MKVSSAGLLMLLASVALFGCNTRESPKGGPGREAAEDRNRPAATDTRPSTTAADNTFALDVPKSVSVTQGRQEHTSVSLNRGRAFDQAVTVSFKADSPGLKIVPESKQIPAGEKKMDVTVEASENATVGDHVIDVTGQPSAGDATHVRMTVTVKKK
jgi:hypothetical protein